MILNDEQCQAIVDFANQEGVDYSFIHRSAEANPSDIAPVLVQGALEAYNQGVRTTQIETVLMIAGEINPETQETKGEAEPSTYKDHVETPKPKRKAKKKDTEEKKSETFMGLPIPGDWDGDYPEMPVDVSAIPDDQVKRLYSEFGYILSRATWLVGHEKGLLANAEHMRELHYLAAFRAQKEGTVEAKKAAAALDEEVTKWDANSIEHKQNVQHLQAMRDVFDGNVERLSREWTMRTDTRRPSLGDSV